MANLETLKAQITEVESKISNLEDVIGQKQNEIDRFEYECSDDEYDEMIDECEEVVTIFGMSYNPSRVLKELDPIAYRCGKSDYESNYDLDDCEEYTDLKDELESLENDLTDLDSELSELQDELDSLESEEEAYSKSESRLNGLYWAETDNGNMLSFKTQDELYAFLNNQ